MQVRVITMRYQEGLQGLSEDILQKVTFGKSVLSVSEHFFLHGNVPHLTLVLQLGDSPQYENAEGFRLKNSGTLSGHCQGPPEMPALRDMRRRICLLSAGQ